MIHFRWHPRPRDGKWSSPSCAARCSIRRWARIQTVVIKPEAKFHGVMEKKGDSYMWLTDDDRHLLVRMEAKVESGTVVARLKKVESLGTPP